MHAKGMCRRPEVTDLQVQAVMGVAMEARDSVAGPGDVADLVVVVVVGVGVVGLGAHLVEWASAGAIVVVLEEEMEPAVVMEDSEVGSMPAEC